ncbi:MAG: DUF1697 domain-containing protein [Pirellulaceae bacterium]|nr:DUF1697 domain-containing protein [Pirellulaceae bacterium]
MPRWIALFRGINVGGNNVLPMKELVGHLEALKLKDVRSYIQSGNVVFDTGEKNAQSLAKKITQRIEREHGFGPQVLLLSREELQSAIQSNPFPQAVSDPRSLHFFFLEKPAAKANIQALDKAKSPTESYVLQGCLFFLHAPEGIGRSKLAATAERHLGVSVTARNYRTVEKIAEMAAQI